MSGACPEPTLDVASAQLFTLPPRDGGLSTPLEDWVPVILVHLPIFKLFSRAAQVGIIAHEMAHARRAARIGSGWLEKLQQRGRAEEHGADKLASKWGFARELGKLDAERRARVNPYLERVAPLVVRRWQLEMSRDEAHAIP